MKSIKIGKSFIAFGLLLGLLLAPVTSVYAEETESVESTEEKIATHVELDIKQDPDIIDGNKVIITASVYSDNGDKIDVSDASNGQVTIYFKQTTKAKYSSNKKTSWNISVSGGKSYDIYAEYIGTDKYDSSISEEETIDVIKYTSLKGYLKTTKNPENGTYGIYVNESYPDYDSISKLAYYKSGNGNTTIVDDTSFSVSEQGTYYVGVYPKQEGDKFYLFSGNVSIAVSNDAPTTYLISAQADDRVTWTKSLFDNVTDGKQYTTYAHINEANKNDYYITDVVAEPSENANVFYNQGTGEVSISNVTGNVSLIAQVEEKAQVTSLEIQDISVSENQNYSEDNASVQFTINVKVVDENGNAIPDTAIYFKSDIEEKSPISRRSDNNGIATFMNSYGIQLGDLSTDYHSEFALTSDFSNVLLERDIHLVLQQKKDLELYENQIIGTKSGENTGKVINVPDNYEIWSGEVHQGALVVGSGQWVRPVNGEFTGLSAGQHIIRFGEKFDKDTNTFYFASNFADFFVPRGIYELEVNEAESDNVIYEGELNQAIEPGQTAYVYVKPVDGYEIKDENIYISKPSYVSGQVRYSVSGGYVVLEGISGSIELKIVATELEADEVPQDESKTEENNTSNENVAEADSNTETVSNSSSTVSSFSSTTTSVSSSTSAGSSASSSTAATGTVAPAQTEEAKVVLIADENVPAAAATAKPSTKSIASQKNDSVSQDGEETTQLVAANEKEIKTNTVEEENKEITITADEVPLAGTDDKTASSKWLILLVIVLIIAGVGVGYKVYKSNILNKSR